MLATKARMRPIRLVIADRRPIVLQGFATLFAAERDFAIVASCLDGASCLKAIRTLAPDLVLVEDGFSDVTASDMLAVVTAEDIPARLVFYTASVAHGDLAAAIAAGSCCAISMREEPEALVQSLRLVAPTRGGAAAGREHKGAEAEAGLVLLNDQERRIMRLVAYGMSNRQIARQLKLSRGAIKVRLDRISEQLAIKGRTEIAAFALSRLFGGIGALAALLYAALDDIQPAEAAASGHEPTDTVTVKSADGSTELITIKINARKSAPASAETAKSPFKLGRTENPLSETPGRVSKAIQSTIDSAFSRITVPAASSAMPASSSFSAFMMTVVAVWICDLLNSVAQASNLGESHTVLASATGDGTGELAAALHSPGNVDANLDSLAWWYPETDHQAFAFEPPRSDTIAGHGDGLAIVNAEVGGGDVRGGGNPHLGSGSIDPAMDHGSAERVATTDASGNHERGGMQATMGDESKPGQPEHGSHVDEDSGAAAKQHGNHGSAEDDVTHGHQQHDVKATKDGPVAATQQSKHDAPDDKPNHGQMERDSHESEDHPAPAKQHAKDDAKPGDEVHCDHSQRDALEVSSHAPGNPHAGSSPHPGARDEATNGSGQAHMAAAPEHGDSFHFKNETASSESSYASEAHSSHGPDPIAFYTAANHGLPPIQETDLIGPSAAEQSALHHHANDVAHHLTHDLFV